MFFGMAIGLLLVILLDQKIRAEGVLRTIYLYPMALSFIVTGTGLEVDPEPGLGLEKVMHEWGWTSFGFDWLVDPEARDLLRRHRRRLAELGLRDGAVPGRAARHRRLHHQRPRRSTAPACRASTGASSSPACGRCSSRR